jgi:hypothetical protein
MYCKSLVILDGHHHCKTVTRHKPVFETPSLFSMAQVEVVVINWTTVLWTAGTVTLIELHTQLTVQYVPVQLMTLKLPSPSPSSARNCPSPSSTRVLGVDQYFAR